MTKDVMGVVHDKSRGNTLAEILLKETISRGFDLSVLQDEDGDFTRSTLTVDEVLEAGILVYEVEESDEAWEYIGNVFKHVSLLLPADPDDFILGLQMVINGDKIQIWRLNVDKGQPEDANVNTVYFNFDLDGGSEQATFSMLEYKIKWHTNIKGVPPTIEGVPNVLGDATDLTKMKSTIFK